MNHELLQRRKSPPPPPVEEPWNHFPLCCDSRGGFPRCGGILLRRIVGQIEKAVDKLDKPHCAHGFLWLQDFTQSRNSFFLTNSYILLICLTSCARNTSRRFSNVRVQVRIDFYFLSDQLQPRCWPPMLGVRRGRHAARHEPRVAGGADQADGAARDRRSAAAAQHAKGVVVLNEACAFAPECRLSEGYIISQFRCFSASQTLLASPTSMAKN